MKATLPGAQCGSLSESCSDSRNWVRMVQRTVTRYVFGIHVELCFLVTSKDSMHHQSMSAFYR